MYKIVRFPDKIYKAIRAGGISVADAVKESNWSRLGDRKTAAAFYALNNCNFDKVFSAQVARHLDEFTRVTLSQNIAVYCENEPDVWNKQAEIYFKPMFGSFANLEDVWGVKTYGVLAFEIVGEYLVIYPCQEDQLAKMSVSDLQHAFTEDLVEIVYRLKGHEVTAGMRLFVDWLRDEHPEHSENKQ